MTEIMEELDIAAITKRAVQGVFASMARNFVVQFISIGTYFALTIILSPYLLGIYALSTNAIQILGYFGDFGLGGALIQKKEEITLEDINSTFYVQQAFTILVCLLAVLGIFLVQHFYHYDQDEILLFYVLVFSFFVSSLKTMPSLLLERKLRFDKLAIPPLIETLVFGVVVVTMALRGLGIMSFVIAIFIRDFAGLIAIYIIQPWFPRLIFSKTSLKHLLSFGFPYQLNSFLALAKDNLLFQTLPLFLPISTIGYISFAQKCASVPLRLVMDPIIRITFPSYSRLQKETQHLGKAIEKSLFALMLLTFPILIGVVMSAPWFMKLVPKWSQLTPALVSIGFFAINSGVSSISTPLVNALSAIGKVKITFYLMIFWTIATWVLTLSFIHFFSFNGVAIAAAVLATFSVFLVVYLVDKSIPFSVIEPIKFPFVAAIIMGFVLYAIKLFLPINWVSILVLVVSGVVVYFASLYIMAKEQLFTDIALIKRQFTK